MKIGRLFLLIFVFVFLFLIFFVFWLASGPKKNSEKERVVFPLGISDERIIESLEEQGFLKSKKIFNLILTLNGWHGKIEPGAYQLAKNMNVFKLAKTLVAGPYQKWVLIPPGKRKEEVALIFKKSLGWSDEVVKDFISVAEEGYLFPDTYLINVEASPRQVVTKLKANFEEKFDSQLQKDLLTQNVRTDTAVKIASLIERESGGEADKAIIAGIIWNRLDKGMKLEIDATVQYAITSSKLKSQNSKLFEDFDFWPQLGAGVVKTVDSPYNTYLYEGLPPGPICSPSLASIKAAVYPANTEALYYLHSPDRQIHTAKTFEEHQKNIQKYLD